MAYGESVRALEFMERLGLRPLLFGQIVDLGCGPEPVLPGATGVNCDAMPGVTLPGGGPGPRVMRGNVDPSSGDLPVLLGQENFDVVFSSHALEHMPSPIRYTLEHWLRLVRPGGRMILYLPDERYYQFDPGEPEIRNPEHLHYLTMDTFEWYALQVRGVTLEHLSPDVDVRHGRYSFLAVFRKHD